MTHAKAPLFNRSSTAFLQAVIVLVGLGAVAFLIWEPNVEGVNRHATLAQKYLDPFVLYVYVASIPFFVGLYQGIKVLGYAGRSRVISPEGVNAVRTIKYCAVAVIAFVAVSLLFMIGGDPEDRPAGTFMRILVGFPSVIVAAAAAMFERVLQNALDLKSENDLTV